MWQILWGQTGAAAIIVISEVGELLLLRRKIMYSLCGSTETVMGGQQAQREVVPLAVPLSSAHFNCSLSALRFRLAGKALTPFKAARQPSRLSRSGHQPRGSRRGRAVVGSRTQTPHSRTPLRARHRIRAWPDCRFRTCAVRLERDSALPHRSGLAFRAPHLSEQIVNRRLDASHTRYIRSLRKHLT